jgi:hypothetical protein
MDLRARIGKTEVRRSLKISDATVAGKLIATERVKVYAEFEEARTKGSCRRAAPSKSQEAVSHDDKSFAKPLGSRTLDSHF